MELARPWYKTLYHKSRWEVAKHWIKLFPHVEIIGITGSVGKTSTKDATALVLAQKFRVIRSEANIDPLINIPRTLLSVIPTTEKVVLELGVQHRGEMQYYLSAVRPWVGVLTNIGWTHTEFFGDAEGVKEEKGQLITSLPKRGYAVLNFNDPLVRALGSKTNATVFYYGSDSTCDLWYNHVQPSLSGTKLQLHYRQESVEVTYPLLGRHQALSAVAASAVGIVEGISLLTIRRGLTAMTPAPHRFQAVAGPNGSTIIDDSYSASPPATLAAIGSVAEFPAKRRIAVLGEMKELGLLREQAHRQVGEELLKKRFDTLIAYGKGATCIADAVGGKMEVREETSLARIRSWLITHAQPDDLILVKGSRHGIHLERLIAGLAGYPMVTQCAFCPEFATERD